MARRKNKISKPKKNTFAIIVDGKTEVWYFQMLKRNEPHLQVNIDPQIPQKKELSGQYKKVLEFAQDYINVFWIIDLDKIIKESREAKPGNKTKIQELKVYLQELDKKGYNNVVTIFNNPCLEYWFLLHYEQTTRYFHKCSSAEKQLKKHLPDYEKTRKFFTKQNQDIYLRLKSNLKTAILNAQRVQRNDLDNLEKAICEMNLFFNVIKNL